VFHRVVVEVSDAVCLGADADPASDFVVERVLQKELAIDITGNFLAVHRQLQLVPFSGGGRRFSNPFYGAALAVLEFPEDQIVFEWVGAQSQVIAIGFQIEHDSSALMDLAGDGLETNRYFPLAKVVAADGDRLLA
jgi:hypothetical protein